MQHSAVRRPPLIEVFDVEGRFVVLWQFFVGLIEILQIVSVPLCVFFHIRFPGQHDLSQ